MRFLISLSLFFLLLNKRAATAQTRADSISLIFPKVVVINSKNEVLLTFDNNRKAFELPSIGMMEGPISLTEYMNQTASEIGIRYRSFRLAGMFTYIYPDKYRTVVRPYFVMQFEGYQDGQHFRDSSYKWFSGKNAVKSIPYPASAKILSKIISQPHNIWAATFEEYGYTNPVDTSKIKFKILEDFYSIK